MTAVRDAIQESLPASVDALKGFVLSETGQEALQDSIPALRDAFESLATLVEGAGEPGAASRIFVHVKALAETFQIAVEGITVEATNFLRDGGYFEQVEQAIREELPSQGEVKDAIHSAHVGGYL